MQLRRLHIIGGLAFAFILISTVAHFSFRPSPLDLSDPNHFHFTDDNYRLCQQRFNCPTLEDWLHSEAEAGHEIAVKDLLRAGAEINALTADGTSALHVAVYKLRYGVVNLLLKSPGVDIDVRTVEPKGGWHDMFSPPAIRWTPLHIASVLGEEKLVKLLLKYKANITATSIEGSTALHFGSQSCHEKVVKILLGAGAGVGVRSMMGATPLIEAANGGYGIDEEDCVKVVNLLLRAKAELNAEMYDGRSAMWVAVNRRHPKIVSILLEHGASLTSSFDGVSTMQKALENGDSNILEMLLLAGGQLPQTEKGIKSAEYQFIQASNHEHVKLVELFLKAGVNVNAVDWQYTALSVASRTGNKILVEMLLAAGADVNLRAEHGNTPLYEASVEGHDEIVERLLDKGASVDGLSQKEFTALHGGASHGHDKVCKLLLLGKANINAKSIDWEIPLHLAATNGSTLVGDVLLTGNVDVNAKTKTGMTPLHYASEADQPAFAEKLIAGDSDVNAQSAMGEAPLHAASKLRSVNMTQILLDSGANVHVRTNNGTTSLDIAVRYHRSIIVETLLAAGAEVGPEGMGKISLWEASGHGYVRILAELLKTATVEKVNEVVHVTMGWTCLHSAAFNGKAKVVEMLLEAGADKELRTKNGQTARDLALVRGFQEVVDLLS